MRGLMQVNGQTMQIWFRCGDICCDRKASYEGAREPALLPAGNMKKADSDVLCTPA